MKEEDIVKHYVQEAFFGYEGQHRHSMTVFEIARYIWRPQDLKLYEVFIPEILNADHLSEKKFPDSCISAKFLQYVPTGRIMYGQRNKAILFEYRLKEARDTR